MEPRKVHFIPGGLYLPLWILNDGNLTARQAAVYAVIWHLSQGGNDFHGTLDFLCDCAKINSRSHVSHILKNLIDKGYIIKRTELLLRNKRINHYQPVTVVFDNL